MRALAAALTWPLLLRQARATSAAWQIAAAYPEARSRGDLVSIADNKIIPAARPASDGARAFKAPNRPSPASKWPQYLTPGCARIQRSAVRSFACVLAPVLQMQLPNTHAQQVVLGGQPNLEQIKELLQRCPAGRRWGLPPSSDQPRRDRRQREALQTLRLLWLGAPSGPRSLRLLPAGEVAPDGSCGFAAFAVASGLGESPAEVRRTCACPAAA